MSIRKGTEWGTPGPLPVDAPIATTDAELRRFALGAAFWNTPVDAAAIGPPITVGLTGGSLWQSLGGASVAGRLRRDDAVQLPIDIVVVDGLAQPEVFVNALEARSRWPVVGWQHAAVAMNGQFLHGLRLGHRAHPGDGLIDVYEADLPLRELVKVVRRARLGNHLPHPGIRERRTAACTLAFSSPRTVTLDGERGGPASELRLTILSGRLVVVV